MLADLVYALRNIDMRQVNMCRPMLRVSGRVIFVGNGGSSAIASHMAIDYAKNGGMRALALNDPAALTCIANDYSYEEVFSKQLELHGANTQDMIVLISSSGRSKNIIKAADWAMRRGCGLITLSGFDRDNPLSLMGILNFWIDSHDYGVVEICHLAILHTMINKEQETWQRQSTN